MIYIDLTDLVLFARSSNVMSGIQRVGYNLAKEAQGDSDVGFVGFPQENRSVIRILNISFDETGSLAASTTGFFRRRRHCST